MKYKRFGLIIRGSEEVVLAWNTTFNKGLVEKDILIKQYGINPKLVIFKELKGVVE